MDSIKRFTTDFYETSHGSNSINATLKGEEKKKTHFISFCRKQQCMGEESHKMNVGGPKGATLETSSPVVVVVGMALLAGTVLGAVKMITMTIEKIKGVKN